MLEKAICTCTDCHNELKSFREIALGICEEHRDLLLSNGHFGGVCWNCGIITSVNEVPRRLQGILTEKYLFSKGCSKCSKTVNADMDWITVKKYTEPYDWAIGKDGRLLKVKSSNSSTIDVTPPLTRSNERNDYGKQETS